MLDQISKALPPMMWLTALKQTGADVVIEGRCTTLTGLSDFVASLEATGYFKRSVEIVSTQTESIAQPAMDLIKFSVKAQFAPPGAPAPAVPGKPAAAPAGKTVAP
jgi:Tfp pilus assembly protein PilN